MSRSKDNVSTPQLNNIQKSSLEPGEKSQDDRILSGKEMLKKEPPKTVSENPDYQTSEADLINEDLLPNFKANSPKKPRRFHLSRSKANIGDRKLFSVSKPSLKSRSDLALFIEQIDPHISKANSTQVAAKKTSEGKSPQKSEILEHSLPQRSRKPPGPNFRRVKFQPKHIGHSSETQDGISASTQGDGVSYEWSSDEALIREMQEIALETIQADQKSRPDSESSYTNQVSNREEDALDLELDEDYVLETYLRRPLDVSSSAEIPRASNSEKVGFLVVDEEDVDLWTGYATSDEETIWDEDDPDSNAEDNPNNDYPEDELDSDDELGEGAYGFRHTASDNEEYDFNRDD
ncbi:MAG: hypothetical protein Q9227_008713 [Pyrenula ochraceoflavens]